MDNLHVHVQAAHLSKYISLQWGGKEGRRWRNEPKYEIHPPVIDETHLHGMCIHVEL